MRRLPATLAAALFLVPGLHDPARVDAGAPVARQEMLSDTDQIAGVVAFIRTHWGNDWKDPVAPGDVPASGPLRASPRRATERYTLRRAILCGLE